jgi:hypothetical protein
MAVNFGKKTRERLSKGSSKPKLVNGDTSEAEDTETDSGVVIVTGDPPNETVHPRKSSHDIDPARTMQVSSV